MTRQTIVCPIAFAEYRMLATQLVGFFSVNLAIPPLMQPKVIDIIIPLLWILSCRITFVFNSDNIDSAKHRGHATLIRWSLVEIHQYTVRFLLGTLWISLLGEFHQAISLEARSNCHARTTWRSSSRRSCARMLYPVREGWTHSNPFPGTATPFSWTWLRHS